MRSPGLVTGSMVGSPTVPMNDLARSWLATDQAAAEAVAGVLQSGRFLLGEETRALERELAAYVGTTDAIALASGTDALILAMLGVGVDRGSEVVLAANAGGYAAIAAAAIGATVVYAEVDPDTACVTASSVAAAIGPMTRAVVVTHLYGNLADAAAISGVCQPLGIPVIEDCAQAIGLGDGSSRAGSLGTAAAFSFYPTKNLGAAGDGGAVTSSDPHVLDRVRRLRQYGWNERYQIDLEGGRNSRIDEVQAALLRLGLGTLDARNDRRRMILARYRAASPHLRWVTGATTTVAHLAVFRTRDRTATRALLAEAGIASDVHYPIPDHLQAGLPRPARATDLRATEVLTAEIVTVPCFPELRDDEVDRVADALARLT